MSADTLEVVKSLEGRLLGLDGHTDSQETNGQYAPFLTGSEFRGLRLYPMDKFAQRGCSYKMTHPALYNLFFDDFIGPIVETSNWNILHGTDAAAAVAINVQAGGVARLTSGANATHTMAANGAQLLGARNFLVSNDEMTFEARLGNASSVASQNYNIGMCDSAATLSSPFTIAAGVVTTTATNAVMFVQDSAATNATTLYAVSVNAGGAPQIVAVSPQLNQAAPSSLGIDTAAMHKYRITVNAAGNASFFIDGIMVATLTAAVAPAALLAQSVGMFAEATGASQTLDVDYVMMEQLKKNG